MADGGSYCHLLSAIRHLNHNLHARSPYDNSDMRLFFRRLALIAIRPRTTMREILDGPGGRAVLPLVALATVSGFFGNANQNVRTGLKAAPMPWLIVIGAMAVAALVMFLLFYVLSWIAHVAGRFLEGQGSYADVRAALAWGLAPAIFALLYRVPVALFGPSQNAEPVRIGDHFKFSPGLMSGGCLLGLLIGTLQLGVLVWCIVISSRTLGEAHRFSSWRGFGTLVIVGITPIVVMIAAFLSLRS